MKIYDVCDESARRDGIFLIGGFVGELIITFTCLNDYILANPQNQNFLFSTEAVESFVKDLLLHENFADGILTLHLDKDPTIRESVNTEQTHGDEHDESPLDLDDDTFINFALNRANITDYGLSFFFDIVKDLVISREFIETLYRVIVKLARTKLRTIYPIPNIDLPVPTTAEDAPDGGAQEISEEEKAS